MNRIPVRACALCLLAWLLPATSVADGGKEKAGVPPAAGQSQAPASGGDALESALRAIVEADPELLGGGEYLLRAAREKRLSTFLRRDESYIEKDIDESRTVFFLPIGFGYAGNTNSHLVLVRDGLTVTRATELVYVEIDGPRAEGDAIVFEEFRREGACSRFKYQHRYMRGVFTRRFLGKVRVCD